MINSEFKLDNIPIELRNKRQWALCKFERIDEKINKVPYQVSGVKASSTEKGTWNTFERCVEELDDFDGLFYCLSEDDKYSVVDFDHCVNGAIVDKVAADRIAALDSYREISLSETGIHVWIIAGAPGVKHKNTKQDTEIYSEKRFISVTGWTPADPLPINKRQNELQNLYDELFPTSVEKTKSVSSTQTEKGAINYTDSEVIRTATKNKPDFGPLFNGDTSKYGGDDSAADMALCNHLAFYTHGDAEQIDRIVRASGLMRQKWDSKRGDSTYGEITVLEAVNSQTSYVDNQEQEVSDIVYARALDILEHKNPVEFILDTYNTLHVGDRRIAKGILCSFGCQCITNTKGLQPKLHGTSGKGKSHAARSMCHLLPQNYVLYESLSDKALFYMAEDLKPGMVVFSDDVRMTDAIEDIMKRSATRFQEETTRRSVDGGAGKKESVKQTIPPRLVWLITSVNPAGGAELVNRQLGFGVDETEATDSEISAFELQKLVDGSDEFPETEDVLTCREIFRIIKENDDGTARLFKVRYANANLIEWHDKRNRRNLPIFADHIKALAVMRFKQRNVDSEGFLLATKEDAQDAKEYYTPHAKNQATHMSPGGIRFANAITKLGGRATSIELQEELGISKSRVSQLAKELTDQMNEFDIENESMSDSNSTDEGRTTKSRIVYVVNTPKMGFDLADFNDVVTIG